MNCYDHRFVWFYHNKQRHKATCSGAPLLTLCILPALSVYVRAVLLSVGLNGRKWTSFIPARALGLIKSLDNKHL